MKAQVAGRRRISKVVITRSREGNSELGGKLRAVGIEPIEFDAIEFLPPKDWSEVDSELESLQEYDWVVFTSATGARFFSARMRDLSAPLPWKGTPRVAAIGKKTAQALEEQGLSVSFVPSASLSKALAEELPEKAGADLLVVRADIGDQSFVPVLEGRGFRVTDLAIYRTSQRPGGSQVEGADAVVFASPSAVEAFAARQKAPNRTGRELLAFCIGPVTAAAARKHGFARVVTPAEHTIDSLVDCIERNSEVAR